MRNLVALGLIIWCSAVWSQEWEDRKLFNTEDAATNIRIISSTDTDLFAPLVDAFVSQNPDVSIEYLVTGTADINHRFRASPEAFDIVISSAMDLQFKLTNDGFALNLDGVTHPAWAQWRQSLFAFTSEPAAIVIKRSEFAGHPIPRSRQELIEALRSRPEVFKGRIGTYDVRQSGLGYLFATQDARASETFWRLMEVMGGLDVQLYCCSGEMIDDLTDGKIAVAYNVLGSYAEARPESRETLEIILPSDFPTTMLRTAFVSKTSSEPAAAKRFLEFLLSTQSNRTGNIRSLPPLIDQTAGVEGSKITLEPTLMTFLDTLKRNKFLAEWENALIHN